MNKDFILMLICFLLLINTLFLIVICLIDYKYLYAILNVLASSVLLYLGQLNYRKWKRTKE